MSALPQIEIFNNGRVAATAELVPDIDHGPAIWLQSDCYIPVAQLDEFIDGLKKVAASKTA
jgi:hypothetical protein